jgi:hypothetical protein
MSIKDFFKSTFDLRALLPRERRRHSPREEYKGVIGQLAGKPRSCAEDRKRAQRRVNRRALIKATVLGLTENPAGAKRIMGYAKVAGYVVQDHDAKGKAFLRRPTYWEALAWYNNREEAPFPMGKRLNVEQQLRQKTWLIARKTKPATPVVGTT